VITVVPYDAAWPGMYAAERDRLAAALGEVAVRIDHFGSTAVPGLAAKPWIDIQVGVRRMRPEDRMILETTGLRDPPPIAGLEWHYLPPTYWSGRLPRRPPPS